MTIEQQHYLLWKRYSRSNRSRAKDIVQVVDVFHDVGETIVVTRRDTRYGYEYEALVEGVFLKRYPVYQGSYN